MEGVTIRTLSGWEQIQLKLLRWFSASLALMDTLLDVRWGERLTDRLTKRWQEELGRVSSALAHLEKERHLIHLQIEAMAIHAAAIYLEGRQQTTGKLRFDPADAHDERLLDATIDTLVKSQLAAIEAEEIEPGYYAYIVEPDWTRIRERLAAAEKDAEPELGEWIREGMRRIDKEHPTDGGA